jgi:hypothetical protein
MSLTTAGTVLDRLQAAGVSIAVVGDGLRLTPTERVTPELVATVRTFKVRLIAWLTWDEQAARDALDVVLTRIGESCTELDGFATDQRRVDCEEAVNVTGYHRDWAAYVAALDAYERHCLAAYCPPSPSAPTGPEARRGRP